MDMVPVESSNIDAVGYAPKTQTLRVAFTSGSVYDYAGVPPEVHAGLMAAESKGRHLRQHVIQAGYKAAKLAPVEDTTEDTNG